MPAPPIETSSLPILAHREAIIAALRTQQALIVSGETGSGKTTQLPQMVLASGICRSGIIAHTQPRRLAARAVASRIAEELNVRLGDEVGVKVRFDDRTSRRTKIKLLTDGMLLAEMREDRPLRAYDCIIIDEAHERSVNIDFLLGVLPGLIAQRPELRVIITSATVDTKRFSEHFGGALGAAKCPVIEVSGRTYPVEVRYRAAPAASRRGPGFGGFEVDPQAIVDGVEEALSASRNPAGADVLVFLPGEGEIRAAAAALNRTTPPIGAEILPLFSRLSDADQDRIFHPGAPSQRRVILATNIAETSLTVPRIRAVVDTGLARLNRYEPRTRIERLHVEPISKASAQQRAGRCGRLGPGVCIRLYDQNDFEARPAFTEPEIQRSNLAAVVLRMLDLHLGEPAAFPFLDRPSPQAIQDAYTALFELGAVDSAAPGAKLTELGRRMAAFPIDPQLARLLIAGEANGCLDEALTLAAALSIQDPRERPLERAAAADEAHLVFRHPTSDFFVLLNIFDQYEHERENTGNADLRAWCRERFINVARMREWSEQRRQLEGIARDMGLRGAPEPASEDAVHRSLMVALVASIMCRGDNAASKEYNGPHVKNASVFPGSVLFKSPPKWLVAAELVSTTKLYARTLARVEQEWVEELLAHLLTRTIVDPHYDKESGEVAAWERLTLGNLVVVPRRRVNLGESDPRRARRIFLESALARGALPDLDSPLIARVRAAFERARSVEAKLRRRDVLKDEKTIAAWFDERLPPRVFDAPSMARWSEPERAGGLGPVDRVVPAFTDLLSEGLANSALSGFPDSLALTDGAGDRMFDVSYRLEPGKDEDGVTAVVPLRDLPDLSLERVRWGVPGHLEDRIASLLKQLSGNHRAALAQALGGGKRSHADAASDVAQLLDFGEGAFTGALSEAVEVALGVKVPPDAWALKSLPQHLQLRVQIVDDAGAPLGWGAASRDVDDLLRRFGPRAEKLRAESRRSHTDRHGITKWDFGDLPGAAASAGSREHAALIDEGDSVTLTTIDDPALARELTHRAVRRLFALAVRDEVEARLHALAKWPELVKQFAAFGDSRKLAADLTCIIAERAFMTGQPPVRARAEFEERLQSHWGALAQGTFETAEMIGRILEPHARLAARIRSGTNRLWAASIADLREQAAYLMPANFLLLVPEGKLRDYPRYAAAMWQRIANLREDGSGAEAEILRAFLPAWKRFTAWVAAAKSESDRRAAEAGANDGADTAASKSAARRASLPPARRAAQSINVDAAEWAMSPGNMPAPVARYRWALEDARLELFSPGEKTARARAAIVSRLDEQWLEARGPNDDKPHAARQRKTMK